MLGYGTFGIGFLLDSMWPLVDREDKGAMHDHVVKTRVVDLAPVPVGRRGPAALAAAAPAAADGAVDRPSRQQAWGAGDRVDASTSCRSRMSSMRSASWSGGSLYASAERAQMLYDALNETPVGSGSSSAWPSSRGSNKLELIHSRCRSS